MSPLPSVDAVLRLAAAEKACVGHGRSALVEAVRAVLAGYRERRDGERPAEQRVLEEAVDWLEARQKPHLQRVYNLTGTVLHTNLGRALLSEAAVTHAAMAMREACALEFDLATGGRGDRDTLVEGLLCELTGAEAATVVNNNAAAVLLVLAALAGRREVVVSRGELVEIGGAFRVPDVMRAANVRLVEVGTTNRTHARDYEGAIGPKTAALMGGPQAGLIVGRKDLISRIRKHPLKRALRVSKLTLAALEATLLAYRKPDFLTRDLPTLRLLTRPLDELEALAARIGGPLALALGAGWSVRARPVASQAGSGSLPEESIPSVALELVPDIRSGKALSRLAERLRALPVPVIGRIAEGALLLDLRCLEDEAGFISQLQHI